MVNFMTFEELINQEKQKPYFINLMKFVDEEYASHTCYPPYEQIFSAFKYKDIDGIKVVILGQDPYHEVNQANGLAFSVNEGNPLPKSLGNIYKELYDDLGITRLSSSLEDWAKQGVFLLNTCLTVEEGKANSHSSKGWEIFTDEVIKELNKDDNPKVFILWGKNAISKKQLITNSNHLVLESAHPSPLSAYRGFFGSKPFSKANAYLRSKGLEEINWR